jgi:hypothetical protein
MRPVAEQVREIARLEQILKSNDSPVMHLQIAAAYCDLERTAYRQCVDVGARAPVSIEGAAQAERVIKQRAKTLIACRRAASRHCAAVAAAYPSSLPTAACPGS